MNTNPIKVKRALISLSDKTDLVDFASELQSFGIEILSTGGTAKALREAGISVTDVSTYTGFPEMMDGRVKTLHPKVHGGILGRRDIDQQIAMQNGIQWIDLVVCNLYPFAETTKKPNVSFDEIVENIDIGGPAMIRSAAKNMGWVTVVVDPSDYALLLEELRQGGVSFAARERLAVKAFGHTAEYDTVIHAHFNSIPSLVGRGGGRVSASGEADINHDADNFPELLTFSYTKHQGLRYGENPHQKAAVYISSSLQGEVSRRHVGTEGYSVMTAKIHQGKELSYNNINDADGALDCLKEFDEPACVVVKHANPCGVATGSDITEVFRRAYNADALAAFGGIVALNRPCTKEIAEELNKVFVEIVMAPSFEIEALTILAKKPKVRVLETAPLRPSCGRDTSPCKGEDMPPVAGGFNHILPFTRGGEPTPRRLGGVFDMDFRFVEGGLLVQNKDTKIITDTDLQFVTNKKPTSEEIRDMLFGWKVLKHVKSNAIVIAKNNTTLGIGPGQVSRVDSVEIAIRKANLTPSPRSGEVLPLGKGETLPAIDKLAMNMSSPLQGEVSRPQEGRRGIQGAVLCSDAFFPFRDSIDKIASTGISAIIQPGGSLKDQEVIAACNEHGIAMVFTGVRCFKH